MMKAKAGTTRKTQKVIDAAGSSSVLKARDKMHPGIQAPLYGGAFFFGQRTFLM